MNRLHQLQNLEASLAELVSILCLDAACRWLNHFELCLARSREYLQREFNQSELNELSGSVMHVFGGMGSFNDYFPGIFDPATGRCTPIPGTENFETVTGQVYDRALALRVIEPSA
jgi:hypothetical protein